MLSLQNERLIKGSYEARRDVVSINRISAYLHQFSTKSWHSFARFISYSIGVISAASGTHGFDMLLNRSDKFTKSRIFDGHEHLDGLGARHLQ